MTPLFSSVTYCSAQEAHLTKAEGCISREHSPWGQNSFPGQLHEISVDETELTRVPWWQGASILA